MYRRMALLAAAMVATGAPMVADDLLYPGIASVGGVNDTVWTSEVVCHNPHVEGITLGLEIVPRGGTAPVAARALPLDGRETVRIVDLYADLGAPDGAGTLRVTGDGMCWVRTANRDGDATFGQSIPPLGSTSTPADAPAATNERYWPVYTAADVATDFRTNLVVLSTSVEPAELVLRIGGVERRRMTVPAGEMVQQNDLGAWLGLAPGVEAVSVVGDQTAWQAYVSVVDPYSGDPTTMLPLTAPPLADAPRIVVQPVGGTVALGTTATLAVEAVGAEPLSYQWYRGESDDASEPMAGGGERVFDTPPVTAPVAYWVKVANSHGSVASRTAFLEVAGQVAAPVLTPPAGTYVAPVDVRLTCTTQGAVIHYTLDGSTPTTGSPVATGPIRIANHASGADDPDPLDEHQPLTPVSARIRSIAVANGMSLSPETSGNYLVDLVESSFGIPYADPPSAGGSKHLLDVYRPRGAAAAPVVVFVHGGAWKQGDKNVYLELGNVLAGYWGIVTVVANYELSADPWHAVHPDHVEDAARAVRWTFENLASIGGDPGRVFLFGQSAGGHLVSLLATDGRYMAAEGLSTGDIAGVVTMSGAYSLSDMVAWPVNPLGLEAAEVLAYKTLMANAFGSWEPDVLDPASPTTWIGSGLPPFRIIAAWEDMAGFQQMAIDFHAAVAALGGPEVDLLILQESDIPSEVLALDLGGHSEEIYAVNTRDHDSVSTRAVAEWVLSH